jgi:adenylyl-sulfate kinase
MGGNMQHVAVGALRGNRDLNLLWQDSPVQKIDRASAKQQKPCCLWFTGLSGAGKTTIANRLDQMLHSAGQHTYVLDGDRCRTGLCRDLDFTEAGRLENVRRISEVAKLMVDAGLIVIVSLISPLLSQRAMARSNFEGGEFLEVFVNTPLTVCEKRDAKGLYAKARQGLIPQFTGVSSPYEAPTDAEIELDGRAHPDELVAMIRLRLQSQGALRQVR